MRRSSLVGFAVARILPSVMSPVRSIPPLSSSSSSSNPHVATTTPMCRGLGGSSHASTTSTSTSTSTTALPFKNNNQDEESSSSSSSSSPPVLLLEGDNFQVSHNGVARTFYHLANNGGATTTTTTQEQQQLGIEEYYNLKDAHKTFVLRRPQQEEDDNKQEDGYTEILIGTQAQGLAPMGRLLGCVDIQEIDQGVFGSAGTGATTWESSLAMGLFFAQHADLLRGDLLEIGSGVGVGAILTHMAPLACQHDLRYLSSVTLTDGNEQCLQQCRQNIREAWDNLSLLYPPRGSPPQVNVLRLDWNDVDNFRRQHYDTIIACDVCYLYPDIEPLAQTIHKLLKKDGCLHLFGPYNRGAFQQLCQRLHQDMHVTIESLGLERYRLKPANAERPPSSLNDTTLLPQDRLYASKSHATILHVSVRQYDAADDQTDPSQRSSVDMRDLD